MSKIMSNFSITVRGLWKRIPKTNDLKEKSELATSFLRPSLESIFRCWMSSSAILFRSFSSCSE